MTNAELLAEIERLGSEPRQAHEIAIWMEGRYEQLLSALRGVEAARNALRKIADMPDEENEWDAVDRYAVCRDIAQAALSQEEKVTL